jgi:hypothetical protein
MLREALACVAEGNDPPCIIRDAAQQTIDFPQKSTMMSDKQEDVDYGRFWAETAAEVS